MKGIAFPVCVSVNDAVCHLSPLESDTSVSSFFNIHLDHSCSIGDEDHEARDVRTSQRRATSTLAAAPQGLPRRCARDERALLRFDRVATLN